MRENVTSGETSLDHAVHDVRGDWSYFTNHAQTLFCLMKNPNLRIRDIAASVNLTERMIHRILDDLANSGVITRIREGRSNRYEVNYDAPISERSASPITVRDLKSIAGIRD